MSARVRPCPRVCPYEWLQHDCRVPRYCRVGDWRGGSLAIGPGAFVAAGFPVGCATPVSLARSAPFPVPATSNRACGSPAHGSPTSFTAGIRSFPPGLPGPGSDGDPVQADQAEFARGCAEHHVPAEVAAAAVLLADEQREPQLRVVPDLAEAAGRVAVPWLQQTAGQPR